jgi:hypothetical protein
MRVSRGEARRPCSVIPRRPASVRAASAATHLPRQSQSPGQHGARHHVLPVPRCSQLSPLCPCLGPRQADTDWGSPSSAAAWSTSRSSYDRLGCDRTDLQFYPCPGKPQRRHQHHSERKGRNIHHDSYHWQPPNEEEGAAHSHAHCCPNPADGHPQLPYHVLPQAW